ncbi:Tubby [Tetrabaena socialis]|uniref:Tubby n=1 Tax=Tetrabaena socialis TaxID=47790 RepID=A0A2J7ZQ72_9CHLO|nr:Tubby [Tetrabaena socialis]|eukprot:PNH02415.1 Tubby [Tetrabaena socialis]
MAKLFASTRVQALQDDEEEASKGRISYNGVTYENPAYQPGQDAEAHEIGDMDAQTITSPLGGVMPASPTDSIRLNNHAGHELREALASPDAGPSSGRGAGPSNLWANNGDVPSPATKRVGSQQSISTPRAGGGSFLSPTGGKRAKNATLVHEITTYENDTAEEASTDASEAGEGVVPVRHVMRGPCIGNWTTNAVFLWEEEVKRLAAAGRSEDAVRWVAPSDGMIRCIVRRVKNFLGNTTAYHLFLDSGDCFMLAARKRKKSKASNFVLSTNQEDLGKDSDHCIAKLRANFVGTEYSLVGRTGPMSNASADDLSSPTPRSPPVSPLSPTMGRLSPPAEPFSRDEVAVHYKQTALTAKGGPRVMLVATPLPECEWLPSAIDGSDSLTNCLEAARRRELPGRVERQLCMLATRPPEWDAAIKAYTLDFHGRVRAASVKNFQLVHWDHNTDRKGSDLVLQFGKAEEGCDDFALDFTYPLSLAKAFSIALASIDSKLCYAM